MQDGSVDERVVAGAVAACEDGSVATAEEGLRLLDAFRSISCVETRTRLLNFVVALANRFAVAGQG